jgi:hypothetical protein
MLVHRAREQVWLPVLSIVLPLFLVRCPLVIFTNCWSATGGRMLAPAKTLLSLKTNLSLENQIHLIVDLQISENLPIIEEAPPK